MAAPKKHESSVVFSLSTDRSLLAKVKARALKESVRQGRTVSASELINQTLRSYLKGAR